MVLIFAKNLTGSFPFCFNIFLLLLYLYFNILLLLSYFLYLLYTVNQFSFTHFRYCVSTFSYKHMPQCKFSLYLKKAGLASRNIVHFLKKVILRCIGLCFHYHHFTIRGNRARFRAAGGYVAFGKAYQMSHLPSSIS